MVFAAHFLSSCKSYIFTHKTPILLLRKGGEASKMPSTEEDGSDTVVVHAEHHETSVTLEVSESPETPITGQNTYAAKKTVAQGMMDIALLTANANQLRYILEYSRESPTFYLNVLLIIISLILQVAVGVSLIFKARFDLAGQAKNDYANRLNNYVVVGVFLVTIINVFVAAFSISGPTLKNVDHHEPPVVANTLM